MLQSDGSPGAAFGDEIQDDIRPLGPATGVPRQSATEQVGWPGELNRGYSWKPPLN
jgi:hypothetical protein